MSFTVDWEKGWWHLHDTFTSLRYKLTHLESFLKQFDTINHDIFLAKSKHYGITVCVLSALFVCVCFLLPPPPPPAPSQCVCLWPWFAAAAEPRTWASSTHQQPLHNPRLHFTMAPDCPISTCDPPVFFHCDLPHVFGVFFGIQCAFWRLLIDAVCACLVCRFCQRVSTQPSVFTLHCLSQLTHAAHYVPVTQWDLDVHTAG